MNHPKKWAKPLEGTDESTFVKVLDAAEGEHAAHPKARADRQPRQRKSQEKLPQEEFHRPLLGLLYEMGGTAHVEKLRPVMEKRMTPRLLPGDFAPVSTGQPRWWSATCWERNRLKEDGYLRDDSKRGVWELSEKGVNHIAELLPEAPENFIDLLLAIPTAGDDADFNRSRSGRPCKVTGS